MQSPPEKIGLRLDHDISVRFERVVIASKRTRTSIVLECIEEMLPKLERQYTKEAA